MDIDLADLTGIDIGQRRVHVVGTGRHQVHAIHLSTHPVIGQTVNHRQAGNTAGALQPDTGHIAQQIGGIAGGVTAEIERIRAERHRVQWLRGGARRGDHDLIQRPRSEWRVSIPSPSRFRRIRQHEPGE